MKKSESRIYFRCSIVDKIDIKLRAKDAGLSISEYCRKSALSKEVSYKLTDEELQVYKSIVKAVNGFTSLSNLYVNKDPRLSKEAQALANEFKLHLNKFK